MFNEVAKLGRLDLHVEAGVAGHRLHHLRQPLRVRRGRRHQREAGMGHAGLLQQGLGARNVALRDRYVLRVVEVARRDPLVSGGGLAVHHHLCQPLSVQRKLEGLAHAGVAPERVLLGLVALADVDRDALVADLG